MTGLLWLLVIRGSVLTLGIDCLLPIELYKISRTYCRLSRMAVTVYSNVQLTATYSLQQRYSRVVEHIVDCREPAVVEYNQVQLQPTGQPQRILYC